jgi:hypothetical protein
MKGLLEVNEQSQARRRRPDSMKQDRKLQVGIDSFASQFIDLGAGDEASTSNGIRHLVERIELADQVGLDVFGVGEHHPKEFLDSAPTLILAAAAARTQRIRLTSAVLLRAIELLGTKVAPTLRAGA